jgi:hypothetical protein
MLKHEVEKRALVFKGKSCPNNKLPRRHFDEGRTALNAPASLTLKREQQMTRPRRSLLFMPGSNARALEKARILHASRSRGRSQQEASANARS